MYGQGHNPSVCAIAQPAPFTQGSLHSAPHRVYLAPEGPDGEEVLLNSSAPPQGGGKRERTLVISCRISLQNVAGYSIL